MTGQLRTSAYTADPLELRSVLPDGLRDALGAALLEWYRRQRRALPWRATRDPYCIWVSEVMLQQTRVDAVIGYYERWMRRFPSVQALATADADAVLRAWEGLGYYSRARNLQRAARQVVASHGGQLPRSVAELRQLPGIGPYSAGAIASIAFDADEPVVDGNVMRVLTRLFALAGDPRRAPLAARLWALARALIPEGTARDFNQALMELGATVCTPHSPRCDQCPLTEHCRARAQDRALDFPERVARTKWSAERRAVAVLRRRGRVFVIQAPPDAARWAGMWQFPDLLLGAGEGGETNLAESIQARWGFRVEFTERLGSLQHQVTRFRIQLDVYAGQVLGGRASASSGMTWSLPAQLAELAMPVAHRKIARSLLTESPGFALDPGPRRARRGSAQAQADDKDG